MRAARSPLAQGALWTTLALATSACTTVLYDGPKRSGNETATIAAGTDSKIESIDGRAIGGGSHDRYEVLQGKHAIELARHASEFQAYPSLAQDYRPFTACFVAMPGRGYRIRSDQDGDRWRRAIVDYSTQRNVAFACPKDQAPPPQAEGAGDGSASPSAPQADLTSAPQTRPSATRVPPKDPNPGTGVHLGMGISFGGDDLVTAVYTNGDTNTLKAGSGLSLYVGGMVTPLWIGDAAGFGVVGNIGWKYDNVGGKNADISFSRFPWLLGLQTLIRASEHGYISIAGGATKEPGARLAGSGDISGQADLQSQLGWMGELGSYVSSGSHSAWGIGLRYTKVHYSFGGETIDGSNLGLHFTLHVNP